MDDDDVTTRIKQPQKQYQKTQTTNMMLNFNLFFQKRIKFTSTRTH